MGKFYIASPLAGFLMLPYLGWTCFATTLINCSLFDSNPAVVQSAHKYAQVKPQESPDMSRANSLHTRNKTAPAEFGRQDFSQPLSGTGAIQYSNSPILGPSGTHAQTGGWNSRQSEPGHSWQPPQEQQQQQQWTQPDSFSGTPFAESQLHRRSATDVGRDRRVTRRTTDDELDSFATHTDSGHLIMPGQLENEERKGNSSGLFGKASSYRPERHFHHAACTVKHESHCKAGSPCILCTC